MQSFKIALIGAGNHGGFILQRLTPSDYGIDLTHYINDIYLVDKSDAALQRTSGQFGIKQIYSDVSEVPIDVDCAIIATSTPDHFDPTAYFLEKQVPTHVATPLAADPELSQLLCDIADKHHVMNSTGTDLPFHPMFIDAMEYINKIKISRININWEKERGDRNHPIPDILSEEGSHPYGLLTHIVKESPFRIEASGWHGQQIVSNEKWGSCSFQDNYEDRKISDDIVLVRNQVYSSAKLSYRTMEANITMDYENPNKKRSIEVVGHHPDKGLFENTTVHLDFHTSTLKVLHGFTETRSGVGHTTHQRVYDPFDTIGEQLGAFFKYIETGSRPKESMAFEDVMLTEDVIDKVKRVQYMFDFR